MPGKRKKDRKSGKAKQKAPQKYGTAERGNHASGPRSNATGSKKIQPKHFSLKDEAAKSTFRSSKRLWQGEGQKLRNLPVEFIKAVDKYDPGEFLRDQIAANAQRQADRELLQDDSRPEEIASTVVQGLAEPSFESLDLLGDAMEDGATETRHEAKTNATSQIPSNLMMVEENPSEEVPHKVEHDLDVTAAVGELHIEESPETLQTPPVTSNVDLILDNLQHEPEDPRGMLSSSSSSELGLDDNLDHEPVSEMEFARDAEETQNSTDAELFVVDTIGDPEIRHQSSTQETILLRPRRTMPSKSMPVQNITPVTPWARTIDDPVMTELSPSDSAAQRSIGHAFEGSASDKRGRRAGKKKQAKINGANMVRRQDEIDIMFDYMENAMWTDEEDEEPEDAPIIEDVMTKASGELDSSVLEDEDVTNIEGAQESDDRSSDDEEDSDDDTDIDDDLELMIDAEMEEMEFDLGYSGGRSSKGRRYGADRELIDHALYHEDFDVYDFNSASEEEADERLGASGARQRGLNAFTNSLDLSDEELEATLIAQWKKDRGSKKDKKRARQKLHQQGLIGKKAKRARASHEVDTKSYGDLDGYHLHIKRFVSHVDYVGIEELPMPAMDKAVRRAVHVLTQAYGLKSASQGSGKRRHIVLYKTKHASQLPEPDYLEETLFRARRSLGFNSKYRDTLLPESAKQRLGRSGRPMKSGRDGGGGGRLRDGDLVGADAPEIHIANKGRQMLEKLGWLHGSGLGAAGNEGLTLPLFATIKNSKHGLQ